MANSKKQFSNEPSNLLVVGLDIGYGYTKVQTLSGGFTFPSVAGHARHIRYGEAELAQRYPGDQLHDDEGTWFIGSLARSQIDGDELFMLRGRSSQGDAVGHGFRVRLAKAAFGKLLAGHTNGEAIHVYLVTGLPVDHLASAEVLKKQLMGLHQVHTDQTNCVVNVEEVAVMPQPYGTLYALMLTDRGVPNPHYTAIRTGILDVGMLSIDAALDDDGEYIQTKSGSSESGIYKAHEYIEKFLADRDGERPRDIVVEEILKQGLHSGSGGATEFQQIAHEALNPVRLATRKLTIRCWQTGVSLDAIYITGGGARFVEEEVKEDFPMAITVQDAQTANARGYMYYGLARCK